jgi:hypothetical protein
MKELLVKKERDGVGFKIMYPTPESRIEELKLLRIPNPMTEEQARHNQKITKQIKEILDEINTF